MKIWVDAQISPHFAGWLRSHFNVEAYSVRYLGMASFSDRAIFDAARENGATVLTKDVDFVELVERHGPPPAVIWLTCGNTSNKHLRRLFSRLSDKMFSLLDSGEPIVEVADRP